MSQPGYVASALWQVPLHHGYHVARALRASVERLKSVRFLCGGGPGGPRTRRTHYTNDEVYGPWSRSARLPGFGYLMFSTMYHEDVSHIVGRSQVAGRGDLTDPNTKQAQPGPGGVRLNPASLAARRATPALSARAHAASEPVEAPPTRGREACARGSRVQAWQTVPDAKLGVVAPMRPAPCRAFPSGRAAAGGRAA